MNVASQLDDILGRVEKPSRYLGNELNVVHKAPESVELRIALAFPDLYDIGLGNLGIHILYAAVNALPWAWCERAAAPGLDMEAELRKRGLPLFALESKDGLGDLDLLGFTLQSELTYTNILNMMDMAGIPLRSADRTDDHPLICAGGPAVFNPEPIAPFMDFFVIGDGEDAIIEICHVLRKLKGRSRRARLFALSLVEGVYVPELYPFDVMDDGRVLPKVGVPQIRKRITRDLNGAVFPVDYIVPFTQQVHDRVSLEVLRGCTQGCRFCQAGMTTRPVRERTLEKIDELLQRTLDATGYEEVSLVSLSTCDHSRVRQLVENTVEKLKSKRVSISLPSLRLDSFSVELADMVAETRRTGLTVAPEAASPRLRAVINKWIPDEGLLEMADGAFKRGWRHLKLYFMIGLPTERDDDIIAIADLAKRTVKAGRVHTSAAKVNLGVSTFVPKPFTPFQWAEQLSLEETSRRQDVLEAALGRDSSIKYGRHHPEETFLEGLVSRSDRRAADLLEAAFRKGCRFDAWREHLRFDLWLEAIEETGFDTADALRERSLDERLPWDHIDVMIPKAWFAADWARAVELKHAEDCRHRKCHKCGVIDEERELCAHMLRNQVVGRAPESEWVRSDPEPYVEPPAAQRLWFRISRTGEARWLSHLEAMSAWQRSLRRAGAPLSYSQGFHPHPKVAFSAAMPSSHQSLGEYMDVTLAERVDPWALLDRLAATLPDGFGAHAVTEVPSKAPSLMSQNQGGRFTLFFPGADREEIAARVAQIVAADEVMVERRVKQRVKKGRRRMREKVHVPVDIRPMIRELVMREGGGAPAVDLVVMSADGKPGKAKEVAALLVEDAASVKVLKHDTMTVRDGRFESLGAGWLERPAPGLVPTPPAQAGVASSVGAAG
ncbi:MAG: radical SAM family uncharacterized protein/radical SAM-linked protein [Myxococcota bacterium]|jgi:radical SAM family uncharacterized protein/radical SAM-linked protein